MGKAYGAFLLRYWRLPGGGQRLDVEHVQTGARVRFATFAAANEWIDANVGDPSSSNSSRPTARPDEGQSGEPVPRKGDPEGSA